MADKDFKTVYVAIGSNLNDPVRQVQTAIFALEQLAQRNSLMTSSLYQTTAMGDEIQPDYINAVVKFDSTHSPIELLDELQEIEQNQGRVRTNKQWQSRTLDLDLLLYGNDVINEPRLVVPHYGLKQRNFVIYPLHEISSKLVLPDGTRIEELYNSCSQSGIRKIEST